MEITKTHNQILIELLDEFVRVCKQYNLRYYLEGGSILGAVRHKGMIPWDDDVDVSMPRKDYETLRHLGNVWKDGYRLGDYETTPGYTYDFLKLEDLNTTLIEKTSPIYIGGVFLDIFPLDNIPNEEANQQIIAYQDKTLPIYQQLCIDPYCATCPTLLHYIVLRIRQFFFSPKRFFGKLDAITKQYQDDNTCQYWKSTHGYHKLSAAPRDWWGDGVEADFEGKKYIVPTNWDAYLTHLFGDYMTPPPVEKRISHSFAFEDVTHRLNEEELRPILKQIKAKYDYHFRFKREIKYLLRKLHLFN